MLFSKQNIVVIFIMSILVIGLGSVNSSVINWGFTGIDEENDVWAGLFVEALGVFVEIALILFVLNGMQEGRWQKARHTIFQQIGESLTKYQEHLSNLKDMAEISDEAGYFGDMRVFLEEANSTRTAMSDFLQILSSALTPEMASQIARMMVLLQYNTDLVAEYFNPVGHWGQPEITPEDHMLMVWEYHNDILEQIKPLLLPHHYDQLLTNAQAEVQLASGSCQPEKS